MIHTVIIEHKLIDGKFPTTEELNVSFVSVKIIKEIEDSQIISIDFNFNEENPPREIVDIMIFQISMIITKLILLQKQKELTKLIDEL